MSLITHQQFVETMRHALTAVSVVTSVDTSGRVAGSTVSAVCSVSAEPPSLLVCLNRTGSLAPVIASSGVFCVNLLAADQSHVADCFAGRTGETLEARFACAQWNTLITGCPVLRGAQAAFDCRLLMEQQVGTHAVFIGSVCGVRTEPSAPLGYLNRAYCMVAARA